MTALKTDTDDTEIPFEHRLRFRGASAAGAVHVLRLLRSPDPSAFNVEDRGKRLKPQTPNTAFRANVMTALFAAVAAAVAALRTALSTAPAHPSGHAGLQE